MKRLFFYLIVTFVLLYLCTGCVVFNGQSLVNERRYSGMGANDIYYTLEAKRYQLRISDGEKTIIVSKKNICQ